MKRILAIVLCLSMLLVGCGKKAPAETTASTPTATSSAITAADTTAATTPIPPRDPAYNDARDAALEELKAYAIKEGIVHKSSKCFWEI